MSQVSIDIEHIALKRLGKKLWQYEDRDPKRVELAVLDYLVSHGWQGYFTEQFDYDRTILIMMLWCNRESYFKEKRKSLAVNNPKLVFNFAADGYWQTNNHKFSHADLIGHATNFSEEMIPKILQTWQDRGVKSFAVGRAYLTPRPAEELSADTLVSFYNARGGLQYYLSFLEHFASAELQQLKNQCRILDNALKDKTGHDCPLQRLLDTADTILTIKRSGFKPTDASIQNWINKITEQNEGEFKDEILKLAVDLYAYWKQREAAPKTKWDHEATLDLIVWKESVVSVEVKAPNDRLAPHQKEQLKLDADNGIKSWVIEVHDGQIDCNKADKKRHVLFGETKL